MNDRATERTYVWAKGEDYAYRNWDAWEPWDWGGDCAVALRSSGKWEMNDCNKNSVNGALCMKGTSESVGAGPTPPPPPVSNYNWGKRWATACTMETLTKQGWSTYHGSSCCQACQVRSFSSPLDKISWKGKSCRCVSTSLDTCSNNNLQTMSGWGSADCTQWQPGGRRKRGDTEEQSEQSEQSEHYSSQVIQRFDNLDIIAAAERYRSHKRSLDVGTDSVTSVVTGRRQKRSLDTVTQREVTCESLWGGTALYWKYEYEVPYSCWSMWLLYFLL